MDEPYGIAFMNSGCNKLWKIDAEFALWRIAVERGDQLQNDFTPFEYYSIFRSIRAE